MGTGRITSLHRPWDGLENDDRQCPAGPRTTGPSGGDEQLPRCADPGCTGLCDLCDRSSDTMAVARDELLALSLRQARPHTVPRWKVPAVGALAEHPLSAGP